jgi:hypothetical protein
MPPHRLQRRAEEARDQVRKAHDHRRQYGHISGYAIYEKQIREAEIIAGYAIHDLLLYSQ